MHDIYISINKCLLVVENGLCDWCIRHGHALRRALQTQGYTLGAGENSPRLRPQVCQGGIFDILEKTEKSEKSKPNQKTSHTS